MASETARQTSLIQEDPPADECRENVPPEVSVATTLKVQPENEMSSPVRLCEGTRPGSNINTLSTPTLSGGHGGKARSQLSGIQSAVTPVLKRLNIDNKCPNPLKHGNSPHPSSPFYPVEVSTAHRESKGDFWRQIWAKEAPFSLIEEESLPEISSLELTYLHLTANDSVLPQGSTTTFSDETHQIQVSVGESGGSSEVPQLTATTTSADLRTKSASALAGILDTEITLLDVSYNNDLSPVGQISSLDIIRDIPACHYLNDSNTLPEPSRRIESQPSSSNVFLNKDVSSTSMQSPKCAAERTIRMSLEVTRDISVGSTLENGTFSSETSGQKMQTSHTSDEDKVVPQPANITHDISASSGNSSSKEIPSDVCLHSGPKEVNNLVETKNEENQTCCDTKSTNKMSQQSPEPAASANDTFTVPSSNMTASSDSSTSASCSGNNTLDLPTVNNPTAESETKNQAESVAKTSFVVNQSSFSEKKNFEKSSLQKSSGGSTLEAAAVGFENLTFDCKAPSQRNGTITLSEISLTDGHHTLDKPSFPKVCNLTTSLNRNDSEETPKELPRHEAMPPPGAEEKPGDTLEVTPALEGVSGDDGGDAKHLSQSGLPVRDGSSDTPNNQSVDAVSNKTPEFNLDKTLDFRVDLLITSTPMTSCKSFNVGSIREAAHKKLYEAGPSKPADAAVSDIPPNIVGDRKTFMRQPAVGTLRPPSRVAPQSSMSRRGSTVPGRLEKMSAGLPLKHSRIQEAAGKPSAAMEEPRRNAGTSGSYNLKSLTAASRKLPPDLQRPPSSTIPRLTTGQRLPTARTHMLASSGPAVPNPVVKQPQGKKHPFPKGEALPVSKKKKTEAPASPGDSASKVKTLKRPVIGQTSAPTKVQRNDAEMPTAGTSGTSTSCDRPSKFRALKPPGANQRAPLATSQSHGCAKCMVLQEELKLKSEEVQRLNEELLKYRKPDDC
nr:mucin-5AC [Nothobranchius furzeri]